MKRCLTLLIATVCSAACFGAKPLEWINLDAEHHFAGRMTSSGYLRGKVVMVDCRDYGVRSCIEPARRMQSTWNTFKMKPFVLIGSHRGEAGGEKIKRIAERLGITYPLYKDAAFPPAESGEAVNGRIYVVEPTGKVLYRGVDDRRACGVVASVLMSMRSPQTAKQWKHYLDFYVDVLPGQALLALREFRKDFPEEAKAYDEAWERLSRDKDVVKLAKLVKLAHQAKDYDFSDREARRLSPEKIEFAIEKFSDLKESSDPAVVQEAKNYLAELVWTSANLKQE